MTNLKAMFARLSLFDDGSLLAELQVKLTWIDQIQDKQIRDESLGLRFRQVKSGKICVPNDTDLRQSILREARSSPYAMHPDGNKMYRDLHKLYWSPSLKREVTNFVARCLTFYQVKDEHHLPSGLL
ncbi:uncharacterized protein LOC108485259 [Gossypium arboreum]|uniref:uncharacterized protein LOC108485259 n=1 Tax=Gossypium arboreum TaxID=29729 RepID=UPI0008197105|nr:uncharacterized protein LOC108485259 [Gossypium arboreum]